MAEIQYTIRRKIFTFLTSKFHIYDASEKLVGYSEQKAFKLKEDIRIYSDEAKTDERVMIKARQIIDFGAAYDVIDASTHEKVGALKRKGFASILRDSWVVMDPDDREIGKIQEDSMTMAMIRRFLPLGNLIPQSYHLSDQQQVELASFRQHFNPFVQKLTVTVYDGCPVSKLLVLSAGVLLVAIEGRQQ
ncbi:MAG: hypothetical protein HY290_27250 [Planctomycetia bacterium]|nr:hypothetical protein [Planctomycetia bacterium]